MSKVSLKLLIDTKANKVLFAEANKQFVDFLFHIMSLPVATIVKLLGQKDIVGCLGSLYKSIESLATDYLQSDVKRGSVLNPQTAVSVPLLSLKPSYAPTSSIKYYYRCSSSNNNRSTYCLAVKSEYYLKNCCDYVTDDPTATCPRCRRIMATEMSYVAPKITSARLKGLVAAWSSNTATNGFVKGVVTYMVMDNLEVKPMSTISGITLLNKFNVMDISSLVEKEVTVSLNEGVAILKAALNTNQVLTTVFLMGNN